MGCSTCSSNSDGKPSGCKSNGGCATGGCNKLNTYDWLSTMELNDPTDPGLVEVSFRNGAHKGFFKLQNPLQAETGDTVVVEADGGFDVGDISLKGALVPLQMKKKSVNPGTVSKFVLRTANIQDIERLRNSSENDKPTLVKARAIARTLDVDMKIGDVEFRADGKKATFYYTADGRVDFRELIRHYAKEFRVKIEMRQIGSRQESSRIGGLGSCGRELCCSTWLTDYKSVTTNAARYQNLAINQAKLSGQCGRLKCCLNYELDSYMEALESFPTQVDTLQFNGGYARLIKTDIFKKLMYYVKKDAKGRETFITMTVADIIEIKSRISRGDIPTDIVASRSVLVEELVEMKSEDLTGHIELPEEVRQRKKKKRSRPSQPRNAAGAAGGGQHPPSRSGSPTRGEEGNNRNRRRSGTQSNLPQQQNRPDKDRSQRPPRQNPPQEEGQQPRRHEPGEGRSNRSNQPRKGGGNRPENDNRKERGDRGNRGNSNQTNPGNQNDAGKKDPNP